MSIPRRRRRGSGSSSSSGSNRNDISGEGQRSDETARLREPGLKRRTSRRNTLRPILQLMLASDLPDTHFLLLRRRYFSSGTATRLSSRVSTTQ